MSDKLPVGLHAQDGRGSSPPARSRSAPAAEQPANDAGEGAGRGKFRFRPAAKVKGVVGQVGNVAADAQRSRLPQMAAALAYRTIFGLIPVIVVALVGLKFFTTEEDIQHVLSRSLEYAGLKDIMVSEEAAAAPVRAETEPRSWLIPGMPPIMLPELSPAEPAPKVAAPPAPAPTPATARGRPKEGSLDEWISGLVNRVAGIPFRTIGVIGLAALIYAAISMLVEIERAFNQIYRVPVGRSWPRRITQYWTLLTLGMLMLFATFYVGEKFKAWASALSASPSASDAADGSSLGVIGYAVTVAISTGLLLLAYTVVPNTRVRLRPALAGAFIAAVLWEAGKWGFSQYVSFSTNYAKLYGSLALLPLFLLWVYVTWVIVLLGLQISYYVQYGRKARLAVAKDVERAPEIVDPGAGVAVTAAIARAFEDGRGMTPAELAGAAGAPVTVVERLLARLVAHGLVHAVPSGAESKGPDRYMLSRPAESISLTEVLEATYEAVDAGLIPADGTPPLAAAATDGVCEVVKRLRKAEATELAGLTAADLLGGTGRAARPMLGPPPGERSTPGVLLIPLEDGMPAAAGGEDGGKFARAAERAKLPSSGYGSGGGQKGGGQE